MPGYPDITPSWLKPQNASVLDSSLVKVLRMLARAIGADDPASQVMGLMGTDIPTKGAQAVAKGIKAYHGSPHDFEKFDLSKIGTGEGAQAYGHGLYFAENEATAKAYRDQLAPGVQRIVGGGAYDSRNPEHLAASLLRTFKANPDPKATALQSLKADIGNPNLVEAQKEIYRKTVQLLEQGAQLPPTEVVPRGKMYEVNIKADPDQFLDWDAPLSQQSEKVRQSLHSAGLSDFGTASSFRVEPTGSGKSFKVMQGGYEYGTYRTQQSAERRMQELVASHSDDGARAYQRLGGNVTYPDVGKNVAASESLKKAGIPGIKYLDQGSRGAGEGTRNYVVFDDSLIDILKKYGLAGLATGGAQVKGLFDE